MKNKLRTPSSTEYRVENILEKKQFKSALKLCREELNLDGAVSILKNFDKLFSLIEFVDQLEYKDLHFIYDEILVKSFNIVGSFFFNYENIDDIPSDTKQQYTNVIKMTVYLFVEFVNSFNAKIETDYKLLLLETKGRNKKQDMIQKHTSDYNWNWEEELSKGFSAIYSIISNNITQLYDPPYVDHSFVSYLASCCYTQLENPSIAFVRTKSLRDSIMQILILLITDYDHSEFFKVKIVQLLKMYEHLALPMAKTVLQVVESGNNCSSIIELIVKEIAESGVMEGIKETNSQEVTGGKSCCAFLVEIAKYNPELLLSNIEHMLPCLESDPYSMRICVLSVLKELIIHILNNDELDELERKIRDDYLSIIQDHLLDVNAFVRSKCLQLFTAIINADCLPKNMYKVILVCAEEKLSDKSSYVTKSAIILIKTLIKLNPYSSDFTEKSLKEKLEIENFMLDKMKEILEDKIDGGLPKNEMWSSLEPQLKSFLEEILDGRDLRSFKELEILENMPLTEVLMRIKSYITLRRFKVALKFFLRGRQTFKNEKLFELENENNSIVDQFFVCFKNIWWYQLKLPNIECNIDDLEQMTLEELSNKIYSSETKITYLQDCASYLSTLKEASKTIIQLMFGNTTSESLEAIDFFTTAHQFGVPEAQLGIDAMLKLIYSNESNIKDAMINSYNTIYLSIEEENVDSNARPMIIMKRLLNLAKSLNVTNRKAFKVLLNEWVMNKTLDDDCIMLLWAWYTESIPITKEDQIVTALLISMLASAKPCIAKGNIDICIQYGLCNEYQLFNYTCQILENITKENFKRLPDNHVLVIKIMNVLQKCFTDCDIQLFNDVASNAINTIFKLTLKPDITCLTLIEKLFEIMKNNKETSNYSSQKELNIEIEVDLFAKFMFFIGHIALQQHNHLENYVSKELISCIRAKYQSKRANSVETKEDESVHDSESAEIEAINEQIRQTCDKQLITGNGILSSFSKHVLISCHSEHQNLRNNSIITLIKFMLVSSSFCQKNLNMFMDLIETSEDYTMRIDLIIGFGWLVFKHPNLLTPFTDKLYARLQDKCVIVRYTALTTIIDLIRQEIIKVRGQITGIARLLVDEDEQIKYTTKQFFGVIAEKGNSLYNVISDIISMLSNPEDVVPENDFQTIMKFLFPLISKERQLESLVDKLCLRLKESTNEIQASYISYCLMQIKYSDKSFTKLSENISLYADKIKNPAVYNNFNVLISQNSRMAKPSTKEILNDLSDKIEKIVADENIVPLSQKTPGKRNTARKNLSKTLTETPNDVESELQQTVLKRSARYRSKVKRRLMIMDSDEDVDDNEGKIEKDEILSTINEENENGVEIFRRTRLNLKSCKKKLIYKH
ncbi:condensin complex subunit 1 isoform X2 [Daktulosphaira vitifoliae]|uniref:condensin complex subunit 1 isoform X2 n=1 Tax=Daktulosphaira vitifoliae TaxID=58002 RepID=UPI0021AA3DE6|nr:condensin complex subunit 1 isoform X2 [Daktulosphaira vitifoliae]